MDRPSLSAIAQYVLRSRLGRDPVLAMQTRGAPRHLEPRVYRVFRYHSSYSIMQQTIDDFRGDGVTWRDTTRDLFRLTLRRAGSLAQVFWKNIVYLALGTRQRLTMQRFVGQLRRRVADSRRRVRQRL